MAVETQALSTEMRGNNQDIWGQIDNHPFLAELKDGTLADSKLKYYFTQNVMYIDAAIQFLAIGAAKAPDSDARNFCVELIGIANEEVEKQRNFAANLPGGEVPTGMTAACQGYTRHLLTEAHQGGTLNLLGAFLACPWTYEFIGKRLAPEIEHPVHSEWMEFYGSEEHTRIVDWQLSIIDRLAADAGETRRAHIAASFRTSMRYEWMFWQMAYNEEFWPV
jgi:thiaminase/transcriptional activator TenA